MAIGAVSVVNYSRLIKVQLDNLERMKRIRIAIEEHNKDTNRYPQSVDQIADYLDQSVLHSWGGLVDEWGHEFKYERSASGYALTSFGRDGAQDDLEHQAIGTLDICGAWDADFVVTEDGWRSVCALY